MAIANTLIGIAIALTVKPSMAMTVRRQRPLSNEPHAESPPPIVGPEHDSVEFPDGLVQAEVRHHCPVPEGNIGRLHRYR